MLDVSKPLALITSFDEFPCVLLHDGLEITCSNNFAFQGSWACVIFAYSLVDLLHDVFSFVFPNIAQVKHGKVPFIQNVIQDREHSCSLLDFPCFVCIYWELSISEEREDWTRPTALVLNWESVEFFNAWIFLYFYFQMWQTCSLFWRCLPYYLICFWVLASRDLRKVYLIEFLD